ncbi:hypothetical protein SPSIL_008900 [Sporomusa silvacetica DSM 10669]|uniref:Uncharacterized protein n=1 Tax=Sporomusa silvacetica DSM 10669 TaxID=1123289 RepID=A0ABZ3IGJ2_9FIRM|nr:hypothetical protein [Sporomusa silvacetica]OZC13150.1 hypothetical protein SPSIL_56060 [Sporomusa silvacetica DSM 10669]
MSHKEYKPLETFIVPTEEPISERIIKRAMFIYDSVHIPDPNETHLLPDHAIEDKYPHMTIISAPFGPHIRTPDYEQALNTTLEKCSNQITRGIIKVVNVDQTSFPYRTLRHAYHWFIGNKDVMISAVQGFALPSEDEQEFQEQKKIFRPGIYSGFSIVPKGYHSPENDYPPQYEIPGIDEERAGYISDVACLRIGRTLKYLLHVNQKGDVCPLFTDEAFAGIVQNIYESTKNNSSLIIKSNNYEQQISIAMEKFLFREIINPDVLDNMSFNDVEKLRGKSWAGLQEVRRSLKHSLNKSLIELEDATPREAKKIIAEKLYEMLDNYQKTEADFYDEFKAMGIALGLKAISIPTAVTTLHQLLRAPGWESLIASGTSAIATAVGLSAERIASIWKKDHARKRIPMYALMKGISSKVKY